LLDAPPDAGEGVHNWLFRVSRQLHAHLPGVEIIRLLEERVATCGRHVSRAEIENAVSNSLKCAWQPSHGSATVTKTIPKWPDLNKEQRESICADGRGLADLWELSNPRIEDSEQHTERIIDHLFPGNPLLCCGTTSQQFDTRPREDWRGEMPELSLIVPSPMSDVEGVTKEGKPSRHTLSNTGARRFLVVEFDTGTSDEHAALQIHLAGYAPLVCAVHSGGKSLHGWFYVNNQPDAKVEKFFRYAVSLGADRATWTRSQFVRVPDGTRNNGKRQTVYFLNYKPLEIKR
jgi:hypothetical protein